MSLELPFGVKILNPHASVNDWYGPHADLATAKSTVPSSVRAKGLTVGVIEVTGVVEYWWKDGITDLDLVEKTSGGGGGASAFTELTDVPSSYTGQAGKILQVNSGETALEFSNTPTVTGLTTDYIALDTNPTGVPEDTGNIWWSNDFSMPYIQLNSGEKMRVGADHYIPVQAGIDIAKGDVIKFTGATGDKVIGGLASSTDEPYTLIGIASENISEGATGFVIQFGSVDQFDTDTPGWILGDLLYLDPSNNGKLTNTPPNPPNWTFPIAAVTRVSNAGRIQVRAIPGDHLHDIIDVNITDITNNEILQWNSAGYWENKTLSEAGIQPAGSYATAAQGEKADTAIQPSDLAEVATSGSFLDLDDLPNTLSGYGITDAATSAQGALADSSVQPNDDISTLTNDAGYIESDPTGVTGADAITNIISLTQAEYDAIVTPDASTIYNITDAPPSTGLQAVVDDTTPQLGGELDALNNSISNVDKLNATSVSTIISGAASGATALQNVVEDTAPQLGGSLDTQGNAITGNYSTDGYRGIITETTTNRSTSLTDAGDFILFDNATSSEYRILDNTSVPFPIGTEIDLLQKGVGILTIIAVSGVRLNGIDAGSTTVTAQWGGSTIKKIATDEWIIVGKINDVA